MIQLVSVEVIASEKILIQVIVSEKTLIQVYKLETTPSTASMREHLRFPAVMLDHAIVVTPANTKCQIQLQW